MANPLLITWDLYQQSTVLAQRLVLSRGMGTEPLQPYVEFWDLATVEFVDTQARQEQPYCYQLHAVSADDVSSDPTQAVCATPHI